MYLWNVVILLFEFIATAAVIYGKVLKRKQRLSAFPFGKYNGSYLPGFTSETTSPIFSSLFSVLRGFPRHLFNYCRGLWWNSQQLSIPKVSAFHRQILIFSQASWDAEIVGVELILTSVREESQSIEENSHSSLRGGPCQHPSRKTSCQGVGRYITDYKSVTESYYDLNWIFICYTLLYFLIENIKY